MDIKQKSSHLQSTYTVVGTLGDGHFGTVYKAVRKQTGEVVAIKRLKQKSNFASMEDCVNTVSEVKIQTNLGIHLNIIQLRYVFQESGYLHMVMDYMESNLLQVFVCRKTSGIFFPESQIRDFCFQLLKGLDYIHSHGYMHRDLKPENVLATGNQLKIADFGLAREVSPYAKYTDYVTTRWYRAPEVLLGGENYGAAVDMWALGAIIAEMYLLRPLFLGRNMFHQLAQICNIMGTPSQKDWPLGHQLAATRAVHFPRNKGVDLARLIPAASESAIHLMYSLLSWDPKKRITARKALEHPFFKDHFQPHTISPLTSSR
ncbi:cyclin-dependent kinase [Ranunculus cassubicifolius]